MKKAMKFTAFHGFSQLFHGFGGDQKKQTKSFGDHYFRLFMGQVHKYSAMHALSRMEKKAIKLHVPNLHVQSGV